MGELDKRQKKEVVSIIDEYIDEHLNDLRSRILTFDTNLYSAKIEEELNNTKKENAALKEKSENLVLENNKLTGIVNELNTKVDMLEKQLELKNKQVVDELIYYKETFNSIDGLYKKYLMLSATIKSSLSGIIGKPQDVVAFLCCIVQKKNLETLWDFACYELNSKRISFEEQQILVELVHFNLYSCNQGNGIQYELLDIKKGDRFDNRLMQKSSNSKQLGVVTEVLLPGYRNANNGKLVKQALVEIG